MKSLPRQTIYKKNGWDEKLAVIQGWARDGLTNEQIANNMGINPDTLYKYKKRYPEFDEALKKGKEVIDYEVENALLKNATGYHYTEEQVTNQGEVVQLKKYSKPQTTAQIYWLKNRKPANWRDKPKPEKENNKKTAPLKAMMDNIVGDYIEDK